MADDKYTPSNKLVSWLAGHLEDWRESRDTNYLNNWKEYEALWRGEWRAEDRMRESERSRIVSPVLQEAIENHASEIEEVSDLLRFEGIDYMKLKFSGDHLKGKSYRLSVKEIWDGKIVSDTPLQIVNDWL